jgi:hypothetical protein
VDDLGVADVVEQRSLSVRETARQPIEEVRDGGTGLVGVDRVRDAFVDVVQGARIDQTPPGITHRDGVEVTRHQPNARRGGEFGEWVAVDAMDPRGAEIDRHRSSQESGVHATPEPFPGLHDEDVVTEVGQLPGGGEAGGTRPHDEDPTRSPLRRAVDPRCGRPTLEECAVHRRRRLARRRFTGEEEPTVDVGAQIVAVGRGGAWGQVAVGTLRERIDRPPGDEGVRRSGNRCRAR